MSVLNQGFRSQQHHLQLLDFCTLFQNAIIQLPLKKELKLRSTGIVIAYML